MSPGWSVRFGVMDTEREGLMCANQYENRDFFYNAHR